MAKRKKTHGVFGRQTRGNPSLQEWLETDGLGGFASSTTQGVHTRRYHGWLFVARNDPGQRFLALSKLEETLQSPDGQWDLSSNFYRGATHPAGVKNLWHFYSRPFPRFIYKVGSRFLEREIFMARGAPGVYCTYRIISGPGCGDEGVLTLRVRPLCNNRFYHYLTREGQWVPSVTPLRNGVVMDEHRGCDSLAVLAEPSSFRYEPCWYKDMFYPKESERGLDCYEDHFSPGEFVCPLGDGQPVVFWAGPADNCGRVQGGLATEAFAQRQNRVSRMASLAGKASSPALAQFDLACDQFVVKASSGFSIIAGYHWFGEWGRDSFIAMPGILLRTKRYEEARQVFHRFSSALQGGIVPNRFVEGLGATYNAADASLWMIRALGLYGKKTGDTNFISAALPAVREIVQAYAQGTSFGVRMDPSGLLCAGGPKTQITWMDAKAWGNPVTPRGGSPVEVNALWIHSLFLLAKWEKRAGSPRWAEYRRLAKGALKEFVNRFTWPGWGLYDGLDGVGRPVAVLRPNSVIAGSILGRRLPKRILLDIFRSAVEWLVTPSGLRTLAPFEKGYMGQYTGGPDRRDASYHQGTAWPWLLGSYFDLIRRLWPGARGKDLWESMGPVLAGLSCLESNPCTGTVFELASGDYPFAREGAVAQAWSVGEVARILSVLEPSQKEKGDHK